MQKMCRSVIGVAAILVVAGCAVVPTISPTVAADPPSPAPVAPAASLPASASPTLDPSPTPPAIEQATGRYLFFGDIFFGRYIDDWSMASPLKYAYPFQNLGQFQPDNYDAWVANFECPAVDGLAKDSAEMNRTLVFNCDPGYLPEVAQWFSAVDLGNNHTDNQGQDGLAATRAALAAHGIQYFGSPDPEQGPNCDVVVLPVTASLADGTTSQYPIPLGFCGYNGVFTTTTPDQVAEVTAFSALLPTIAWPHSGAEYQPGPDQIKTTLYRSMIDAGADMVIGNHAHWIQSTEAYKGKLIVYSMGNFIFDQQATPEKTRSAIIDVTASVDDVTQLAAWSAIAAACEHDFARCTQLAAQAGLTRLHLSYTYDVHGSNDADKLVKPATPAELASIKQRLGWDATLQALG